jgi:protein tyrosine/serine phosphatase
MSQQQSPVRRAYKQAKREARQAAGNVGRSLAERLPHPVRERASPIAHRLNMLLMDVGAVRFLWPNRHKIAPGVWRSAQPLPHHIRAMAQMGVKTIINLRGDRPSSTLKVERATCREHGIHLINFEVRSRETPSREEIHAIKDLFDAVEYPFLMHCKSGADRVGLMSALYLHLRHGIPIEEAKKQLSIQYGHVRQANTGVLDEMFERYLKDTQRKPMRFMEWIDTVYDPIELKATFRSKGWANRIVDNILSRE